MRIINLATVLTGSCILFILKTKQGTASQLFVKI